MDQCVRSGPERPFEMEKVTISSVDISDLEKKYVNDALDKEMLSAGKYLDTFEKEFANFYGKQYGIMVNSGQSAIEVAIAASFKKNKYALIGVPALTYMATIWGAMRFPAHSDLAFFDIKMSDYGIDFTKGFDNTGLEIRAEDCDIVIPVDLFGKVCKFQKAKKSQIVIEDACESTCNYLCDYGDFVCFSFYSSHIISTGGAGIVITDDERAANFIRGYIAHGRTHSGDFTKNTGQFMDRFVFAHYGQSLRSDNLHAALALAQLRRIDDLIAKRVEVSKKISARLEPLSQIAALPNGDHNVFMFYPIVFNNADYVSETGLVKFEVIDLMRYLYDKGIDSRRFMPVVSQPAFRKHFSLDESLFPVASLCAKRGILLGCHPKMTDKQIDYMCDNILEYFKGVI